jgi:CubicO group peptidase (beta-lactamase class C family)
MVLTLFGGSASAQSPGLARARPEDVGLSSAALAGITPSLRAAFVDSGRIPGFVVAVARHGKLALLDSTGVMEIESGQPMRTSAGFRIASMTKPITAVAVMQLVERGKLRLTDPVSRYIPRFAHLKVAVDSGVNRRLVDPVTPVTVEHLLTITAGLPTGNEADAVEEWAPTIADFADSIAALPLADQPGSAFSYFSGAYDVLARVVEIVSGQRFDRYLETEIFVPLGMRETAHHPSNEMDGRIPRLYSRAADGSLVPTPKLLADVYRAESRWYSGATGLLSTITDYLRFAQMLLNGGELEGRRILQRSSVDRMMTRQVRRDPSGGPAGEFGPRGWIDDTYAWGYGGVVRVDSSSRVAASAGTYRWLGGHWTFFWVDRKAELIGMIWAQMSFEPEMGALDRRFEEMVYRAITGR